MYWIYLPPGKGRNWGAYSWSSNFCLEIGIPVGIYPTLLWAPACRDYRGTRPFHFYLYNKLTTLLEQPTGHPSPCSLLQCAALNPVCQLASTLRICELCVGRSLQHETCFISVPFVAPAGSQVETPRFLRLLELCHYQGSSEN